MIGRTKSLSVLLVSALLASVSLARPQPQAAAAKARTAALSETLPLDPEITVGKFANGLGYCIRENKRPEKRAELRLIVNAGSILEDDDQLGLAHLVEHMAFNGTAHFAKQQIVEFMESIGMRFGPSLNAFTSFDETVYMLQVPTDKPEVLEKAFLILEDWAHGISFDPAEIDKERGVIVEEWRQGRGAAARIRDRQFPILFRGSRYAERLPIGKMEIIEKFEHARLKKFYTDWYRPDLMTVVAVGDFDRKAVEELLKKRFASIPAPRVPRLRPTYKVPGHDSTLYAIATDKELTTANVGIVNKLPLRDTTTVGAYRHEMAERLLYAMLNTRFEELAQKPDPPFLGAGAGRGSFVRTMEASTLSAAVKQDGIERALGALLAETERAARFGFTAPELERQKQNTLRSYEQALAEKEKRESASHASELVRYFTSNEPVPGIAYEYELARRFLPEITLEEVNRLAAERSGERDRVVLTSAPEKEGLAVPDEKRLAAVIKSAAVKELSAYVDTVAGQRLLDELPAPRTIVKTAAIPEHEITEWNLSNGVRVVLKPTNFKEDEVVFRAFSPGGSSLASDEDFIPAMTAGQVIAAGGLGKFSAVDLQKVLAGKIASVRPVIGENDEGLSGSGSRKDLETMFQLINLTFTQPRADAAIFSVLTGQSKAMLANQRARPEFAFSELLTTTLSQNHLRRQPMTPELIDKMNLDKSFAFYKDRFADAADFTFVFVGSFDLATIKPLVERYLASLPSTGRRETWKDVGVRPPKGIVEKSVEKGQEPKSQTAIVFTGDFRYDQAHRIAIRGLAMVLESRLREVLREQLSGTYGVSVSPGYSKVPREEYTLSISFGSSPERAAELAQSVFREIEQLQNNGPTEQQVRDAREGMLREYETSSKQNANVLAQIYLRLQTGEDVKAWFGLPELYRKLDAETIREAARTYLDKRNYVKVTLLPEAAKPQKAAVLPIRGNPRPAPPARRGTSR